jgi:hypothetical protein
MYIVEISVKRLIFYTSFSLFEEKKEAFRKKLLRSMYLSYYLTSYRKSLMSETMTATRGGGGGGVEKYERGKSGDQSCHIPS